MPDMRIYRRIRDCRRFENDRGNIQRWRQNCNRCRCHIVAGDKKLLAERTIRGIVARGVVVLFGGNAYALDICARRPVWRFSVMIGDTRLGRREQVHMRLYGVALQPDSDDREGNKNAPPQSHSAMAGSTSPRLLLTHQVCESEPSFRQHIRGDSLRHSLRRRPQSTAADPLHSSCTRMDTTGSNGARQWPSSHREAKTAGLCDGVRFVKKSAPLHNHVLTIAL